jgi:outer membrane biosynthesis protein TonB
MTRIRKCAALAALLCGLSGTSCQLFRKKAPVAPSASAPRKPQLEPPAELTPLESPAEIPPPPELPPQAVKDVKPAVPGRPKPITTKPPSRKASKKPQPVPVQPPAQATAPAPAQAPAPLPQLKPILSKEHEKQLNDSITKRLDRARQILKAVGGRQINQQQAAAVQQIQTFIQQAEEERKSDLIRANNLAERADVLSRDLVQSFP